MKSIRVLCLILALIFTVVGCEGKLTKSLHEVAADDELEQKHESPLQPAKRIERYIYKQTPQGELAIYVHFPKDWTADDKRPAIVFFFGGGWRTGTVEQFVPQAECLAGRGMVTARADYRVKSRHGTMPDKCVEDAKSAVRWLRSNASMLGIDPKRIAASGSSAGAHVATCTSVTKGLEAKGEDLSISSKPNLLVLFSAPFELSPYDIRQVGSKTMAAKISPIHNLSQDVPPAILLYGMKDRRHVLDGLDFIKKSEELGTIAELYVAEGQNHSFHNRSPWLERTIYLMDEFLMRYGYVQGEPTIRLPEGKVEMKKISTISIGTKDTWGYTRLHRAARHGSKELAELLISKGEDIDAKDKWGWTPLLDACHIGHMELIELLIANGANVNARDENGYTPLYSALWDGDKDMIRALVTNGADVNYTFKDDYPPLHYAVWNDDIKLAELYVDHGAKCNLKDKDGFTAFEYAMENHEMVEMFIAKGATVSGFHLAAWRGDLRRVKRFVEQGANVNAKDNELKWTALNWATFTGQKDVIEFLIAKGANVNAKDERGVTALHRACGKGHQEVVSLLIAGGADINAKKPDGRTPLHRAAEKGYKVVVELLIANGADVNAKYPDGHTSLHLAAEKGYKEVVELLIANGADVNAKDKRGYTPLCYAIWYYKTDIARLLIEKGADVHAKDKRVRTPLDIAVDRGHTEIVELLRKLGVED